MDYTSNYRFKLPAKTDVIDITVLNSNFSAVDKKLAETEKKKKFLVEIKLLQMVYIH